MALLLRVPERWAEFDRDALTATESKALYLLVAAGMVERRIRFRVRLLNHPVGVEGTFTATGEYGTVEALKRVSAAMLREWGDVFLAWQAGETSTEPAFFCEHLKPDDWRLTDQGTIARADLDSGKPHIAIDFVLRRGFFDGQPRLVEGRVSRREPVRGSGELLSMRRVSVDMIGPIEVSVGNWAEGAKSFAEAFGHVLKQESDGSQSPGAPLWAPADATKPTRTEGGGGRPSLPAEEARRREHLVQKWRRAHEAGTSQSDFCVDEGITIAYLTKCINWAAQRRRRTTGP